MSKIVRESLRKLAFCLENIIFFKANSAWDCAVLIKDSPEDIFNETELELWQKGYRRFVEISKIFGDTDPEFEKWQEDPEVKNLTAKIRRAAFEDLVAEANEICFGADLLGWLMNDSFAAWKFVRIQHQVVGIESWVDSFNDCEPQVFDNGLNEFYSILLHELVDWIYLLAGHVDSRRIESTKRSMNYERDEWMTRRKDDGATLSEIVAELKSDHPEWEQIHSTQGVHSAIARYRSR